MSHEADDTRICNMIASSLGKRAGWTGEQIKAAADALKAMPRDVSAVMAMGDRASIEAMCAAAGEPHRADDAMRGFC